MSLHGKNFIGSELSARGQKTFFGFNPRAGKQLDTPFHQGTIEEVDRTLSLATDAFPILREASAETIAEFLENIANEIEALGEDGAGIAMLQAASPLVGGHQDENVTIVGEAAKELGLGGDDLGEIGGETLGIEVGAAPGSDLVGDAQDLEREDVIGAGVEDVRLVLRGGSPLYGDAELVQALQEGCAAMDVCGRPREL